MLIYKNTFDNVKTINCNFPIEDQFYADDIQAIVADGITRDPIGVLDLSSCSFEEMLQKYPRPSGAELAAKEIVTTFSKSSGSLKERLIKCNNSVKKLNDKYIKKCDYLQNDYYGAVASCVSIKNDILYYAYICDCGVIVYNELGEVRFQTRTPSVQMLSLIPIGIPWNLPESRVIIRRDYRNNLDNIVNGKCVSYGALTGEKQAEKFIRIGSLSLNKGDIIVVYSDGFMNFLHNNSFIKHILNFNKDEFEQYVEKKSNTDYDKYGKEKTIILLKYL